MIRNAHGPCWNSRRLSGLPVGLLLMALLSATGCQRGYRWDISGDLPKAEQKARDQGKVLFIFYQYWLDPASSRMKGRELLSDPLVEAEFQDTVNLLIDREYGSGRVGQLRKYKVSTYPAFVLVAPNGKYKYLTGIVPREQFLQWVRDFKVRATQPAAPGGKASR